MPDESGDSARPAGCLYIVSTPIGNLGDMSERAAATLREVDVVLCEDTRYSRRLLDIVSSSVPTLALHEHNEQRVSQRLVSRMLAGERMALISDAGTPLLSDPGARLVRDCVEAGVSVLAIPGASALLAALVVSGLAGGPFTFFGFPPRKGPARRRVLAEISASAYPSVLYESGNRVAETLVDLVRTCGESRRVAVCRELTKRYEEIARGTAGELTAYYEKGGPKGEVVLVVEGARPEGETSEPDESGPRRIAATLYAEGRSTRDVAQALMGVCGLARNVAYAMAREVAEQREGSRE
ncbi:MAG: 16S rRNA (cytidine(1402)-2'-O)-methyltransferase [Gemmatimonadota bacterium]